MTEVPATGAPDIMAAIARLRAMLEAPALDAEATELIALADAAALGFRDPELRAKLSENLISALTVLRFSPILGGDPEPARRQAHSILAALEKAASTP